MLICFSKPALIAPSLQVSVYLFHEFFGEVRIPAQIDALEYMYTAVYNVCRSCIIDKFVIFGGFLFYIGLRMEEAIFGSKTVLPTPVETHAKKSQTWNETFL